jgi:microcystin-dependent protein
MANTANFAVEKPTVGGYRNTWGGTVNTGFDKIDELLALAMPVGTIQMYPLATAPTVTTNGGTWLACDATAVSRTVYSVLYGIIGTTYGVGDGSTSFNLPDLRSRVPVGYNVDTISGRSTRAIAAGSGTESHTLLDAEIPKHTHPITDAGHIHATTEVAHTHTGTTAKAKADIVLNDHTHTFERYTDYGGTGAQVSTTGRFSFNPSRQDTDGVTDPFTGVALLNEDGASNNGHQHSITTDSTATALSIDSKVTGITVDDQGSGDGAHNIMQPYLVVNYIILAKHPTF